MATRRKTQTAEIAVVKSEVSTRRSREQVFADVCAELSLGMSLEQACRKIPDAPHPSNILLWTEKYPGFAQEYAHARSRGYQLLADRINTIAAETHAMITVHAQNNEGKYLFNTDGTPVLKEVLAPLSSDVIASKRLQVDTLKWQLSKMLPKIYGDKTTTELTGPGGGPVQVAAASFTGLSDEELNQMHALMSKAAANGAK